MAAETPQCHHQLADDLAWAGWKFNSVGRHGLEVVGSVFELSQILNKNCVTLYASAFELMKWFVSHWLLGGTL